MSKTGIFEQNGKFLVLLDGEKIKLTGRRDWAEKWLARAKKQAGAAIVEHAYPNLSVVSPVRPEPAVVQQTTESVSQTANYIPPKDPGYVPFGDFKDVNTIVSSGKFFPVYITGPSGNGKSTMVEQAAAKNKRKYIRVQINKKTDEESLIGSKTLENGNVRIVEGPLLIAMREGAVITLDELDAGDPNNLFCLHSILEGKPYYFKLKNEWITPAPGFNIFGTGNTKGRGSENGRYIGTSMLNEAFLERFYVTIEQEYPSPAVELKIVKALMTRHNCLDEKVANTLVKWSDTIRRAYADNSLDDLITTRRLLQIVESYAMFKDINKAVSYGCNRFDTLTKTSFVDVFEKISPDDTPVTEEVPVETVATEADPF